MKRPMSKKIFTTLRSRAVVALTAIFLAMGLGCVLIVGLIITDRLDSFERDLAAANVRRARNSLQQDMQRIDNLLKDWAWWDDTYEFMFTVSDDYAQSNITQDVFINQNLSAIVFVTDKGEILSASRMSDDEKTLGVPSEALLNYVRRTGLAYPPEDLFSGSPALVNIDGSLWIAASRAVLTSLQTGPARGRLWMIQQIDEAYVERLTERTELALQIHVAEQEKLPRAMLALHTAPPATGEPLVVPERDLIWSALLLSDAAGGTPIAIIANAPRELSALARATMKTSLAVVIVFGFVGFFSGFAFLEKSILSRLSLLSARVRKDAPDAQFCKLDQHCDEIDQLSSLVDTAFESILENERFLKEILGAIKVGVMLIRKEDRLIVSANPYASALAGRPEKDIVGKVCHQFTCGAEVGKCPVCDLGQNLDNYKCEFLGKDGERIDILKSVTIIMRNDQEYLLETFWDIREIERTRRLLEESEERYRAMFMNTGTPGILINEDTSIAVANTEFLHLAGLTQDDMRQSPPWTRFFHPDDTQRMLRYHTLRRQDDNTAPRTYESRLVDSSGGLRHVQLTVAMIPRSQQSIAFLLDITDIKRAEGKLHELAYTDALTGLPNRLSALDRLTRTLTHLDSKNSSLGVFLLDLDDFKIINDSWGHAAGDVVLMEVGQRLLSVLDSSEMLARLGGDEFIVVSGIGADESEYSGLAQKLIDTFSSPFELEGSETFLGVSVGVAVFPRDGDTAGQLVRCADLAMYQSKSFGKNMFHFHSPELTLKAQRRVEIERELRLALDAGEIEAFFQPVIDLDTQKIVGAEALARWRKSDGTLVSPVDFIPVAEQTNLITDIDFSILSQACHQAKSWDEDGWGRLRISCNISARHFQRGNLPREVQRVLEASKLPPEQLTLEVTETVYMENMDQVRDILETIDKMGVMSALDDFGTGYSSLSYVRSLSFDVLKIDKSFVKNLPEASALALIRAMLGIAISLEITPLAEGIETPEQLLLLRSLGCRLGQGYLFSPPVTAAQFEELLKKQNIE
ncbi:PAS domain S-box-containing protein/diguanylate cyclase (GGDEF) domain-containing protein [Desulfomicrobium apsheronum]|uniref:PAS domain S-box-containing protein/diguanylate cyclase (GGDEF) domain-containing protein n=2 Tax=Desulfomicrobium apsheronum TaxID=52560 RepID=A0A1I3VA97_9BACT|nr:PAS domain S-box-containing protein/diguanylate cyclase (GGDEF) domain-containing protein [Desulfomicrobium apsheronum]